MGNDGGSIPKRHELVKEVQAAKKVDRDDALLAKWGYCKLSKAPLREPVVADQLGQLYNKEEILKFLLEKKKLPTDEFDHIRKMKDLTELKLTKNTKESFSKLGQVANLYQGDISPFICPITSVPMNGKHRFSFLRTCGCVFSEKALKEVQSSVCLLCAKPFSNEDIIPIYSDKEEMDVLRKKLEEKISQEGETKKPKKRKNKEEDQGPRKEEKRTHLEGKSDSYKSLFRSSTSGPEPKQTYLTMGTYTFYPGS